MVAYLEPGRDTTIEVSHGQTRVTSIKRKREKKGKILMESDCVTLKYVVHA